MKLTIADIAKLAGVSKSTVSRVINDKPDVSKEVKETVRKLMNENNYYPNAAAQSVAKCASRVIALIMPYGIDYVVSNPFYAKMINAITYSLEQKGYYLLLTYNTDEKYMELISRSQVDGFIVLSSSLKQKDIIKFLIDHHIPCVTASALYQTDIPSVDINNFEGGKMAVNYLIGHGHQKIAYIYQNQFASYAEREKGYLAALKDNGITPCKDFLINVDDPGITCGYGAAIKLFDLPELPTAVFTCNDFVAMGVIKACAERGIMVPEQLSIVGFDNNEMDQFLTPALTSVDQCGAKRGHSAAEMVVSYIETGIKPQSIELSAMLMERDSVYIHGEKNTWQTGKECRLC